MATHECFDRLREVGGIKPRRDLANQSGFEIAADAGRECWRPDEDFGKERRGTGKVVALGFPT
jgi:hypothetical protein